MTTKYLVALTLFAFIHGHAPAYASSSSSWGSWGSLGSWCSWGSWGSWCNTDSLSTSGVAKDAYNTFAGDGDDADGLWNGSTVMLCLSSNVTACYPDGLEGSFSLSSSGCRCYLNYCDFLKNEQFNSRLGCKVPQNPYSSSSTSGLSDYSSSTGVLGNDDYVRKLSRDSPRDSQALKNLGAIGSYSHEIPKLDTHEKA